MKNILNEIARTKCVEVESLKRGVSADEMRRMALASERNVLDMKGSILARGVAIIAEHKRRSPSKGEISPMSSVAEVAAQYAANGATAMSVLTDTPYFGGSLADLSVARVTAPRLPLLRKEFIVDEYQVYEAKVYGADAILLIAAMIEAPTLLRLHELAHLLGMQTLVEVHNQEELAAVPSDADMVGVNNRDLTSFATDVNVSRALIDSLPAGVVKVAESGIKTPDDVGILKAAGFDAFLIGEAFMSAPEPGLRLSEFRDNADER